MRYIAVLGLCVLLLRSQVMAFREDFNTLDTSIWQVYTNGGNASVTNGKLLLSTNGYQRRFPYVYMKNNEFPAGEFTVKIGIRFPSYGPYGVGIGTNTWTQPNGVTLWGLDDWIDGFGVGGDSSNQSLGFTSHDFVWTYRGGHVDMWKDGLPIPVSQSFGRPVTIEIGNARIVPGNFTWTSIEVDYIEITSVPEPSSSFSLICSLGGTAGLLIRKRR